MRMVAYTNVAANTDSVVGITALPESLEVAPTYSVAAIVAEVYTVVAACFADAIIEWKDSEVVVATGAATIAIGTPKGAMVIVYFLKVDRVIRAKSLNSSYLLTSFKRKNYSDSSLFIIFSLGESLLCPWHHCLEILKKR